MNVATIGVDLAKNVLQIHGVDAQGNVVILHRLHRRQVIEFFAKLPVCLVGMWARQLTKLGHTVRLLPPAYVKAYVKRSKNDAADAAAICEAVTRPSMRFVKSLHGLIIGASGFAILSFALAVGVGGLYERAGLMKTVVFLVAAAVFAAMPAEARIVCNDGFQVVNGSEISTPYCRDQYLARIARRAGFRVSDAEIRNNPNIKLEVCRFVGSNIEAQAACAGVEDGGRDRR